MRRLKPFYLGVRAGLLGNDETFTFDGNAESPRSQAFDRGMNLGERVSITVELWRGGPLSSLPPWLG